MSQKRDIKDKALRAYIKRLGRLNTASYLAAMGRL